MKRFSTAWTRSGLAHRFFGVNHHQRALAWLASQRRYGYDRNREVKT